MPSNDKIMQIKDKTFEIFISNEKIVQRAAELAAQISQDYEGKDPLIVAVLNGSLYFFTELTLGLDKEIEIALVRYQSYQGTKSTGEFVVSLPFGKNVTGRDVILVEDIVDTGGTLAKLQQELQALEPKSVAVVTLLLKPTVFQNKFPVKYVGFEIPEKFVLGYGLDYDGRGRNLRDIYVLSR